MNEDSTGTEIDCSCQSVNPACMPIIVPYNDKWLGNECGILEESGGSSPKTKAQVLSDCQLSKYISTQACMNFTRSSASFSDLECSTGIHSYFMKLFCDLYLPFYRSSNVIGKIR